MSDVVRRTTDLHPHPRSDVVPFPDSDQHDEHIAELAA